MPPKTKPDADQAETTQSDAVTAEPTPAAIPDPVVTSDAEGVERPLSGGSFIRDADGKLTRNPEA